MPLSLKSHHHNDEPQQQLLQPKQPQSPRTTPKNRRLTSASPPEQDQEQEQALQVEPQQERPIEQDLEVPLVGEELEQQRRKSLLGRPYWKRAVNRGLRVRKEQGIRGLRNNNDNNNRNQRRRESAYSDGDDPSSLPQNHSDLNISSSSLPINRLSNKPMTRATMPINNNADSNEGQHSIGMLNNALRLSLDANQKDVVTSVERVLIHIGLLLLAYSCGVYAPGAYPLVRRLEEYLVVAWLTCRIILLLSLWNNYRNNNSNNSRALVESLSISSATQIPPHPPPPVIQSHTLHVDVDEYDHVETDPDDDVEDGDRGGQIQTPALIPDPSIPKSHPALEHLFIMNTSNGHRFFPNTTETFVLDNPLFKGRMLSLIRTPDVDHPGDDAAARATAHDHSQQQQQLYSSYFAQKQRRFEFQWQFQLKQKPNGRVFFACELEEPVKMGVFQRAFVAVAMAFVQKMSHGTFDYSITGSSSSSGTDEKPHMAFGVETGFPRIVVTKPGETPPMLGQDLMEDSEHLKRRLKTGVVDWNTEDTYTMSMYSSYFDFLQWKTLNFPGIKPFGLASVVGPQPIHLTLYVLPFGQERHSRSAMQVCADLEISNMREMEIGTAAKAWIEANSQQTATSIFRDQNPLLEDNESVDEDSYLEEQTIAELGGGLYLRSGDPIILEVSSPDQGIDGFVCNGGGFTVVQESASAVVVLEKATMKKTNVTDRSLLIRSGDTVKVKLLVQGASDSTEYKYLSIHRGWWLKWVNAEPKNNGFFSVHIPDTENFIQENQSSYVTIGGTFGLQHKRWNGFHVGVRTQESATYGGRMLGLYDSANRRDEEDDEVVLGDGTEGNGGKWMKPILFCAQLPASVARLATPKFERESSSSFENAEMAEAQNGICLTTSNCNLDVPVWIEMLDRTERRRKLVYVVRVIVDSEDDDMEGRKKSSSFCRLRSGRTLAGIIRSGLGNSKRRPSPKPTRDRRISAIESRNKIFDPPVIERLEPREILMSLDATGLSPPRGVSSEADDPFTSQRQDFVENMPSMTDDDGEQLTEDELDVDLTERTPRTKGRKIMDQIAKTVNFDQFARSVATSTAKTGKQVVKQGKKVGVTAGKAIIAPVSRTATAIQHSKKPPTRDPKAAKVTPGVKTSKRRKENDFLAVNRTVKRFEKRNAAIWRTHLSSVAGLLSPSEQSLRTTSRALNRISSAAPSSQMGKYFEAIAHAQFLQPTELDMSFLQGGAYQVGVVPPDDQKRLFASLVARCLWESHWREEWLGVYEKKVVLFTPGSKQPSLQLSFFDISLVRPLDLNELSPLPGYPIVVIETAWQCYYLAFPGEESRDEFCLKIMAQKSLCQENIDADNDMWKARFWQGFQDSVEAAASTGNQKWSKIPSGSKSMHRSVMNGRRMTFDIETLVSSEEEDDFETQRIESFVGKLLAFALSTTFDTIETDPASFSAFLDMTSQLRSIQLDRLDLTQPSALCIFANIYHCLLQHALLLTINGPLYKKSVGHFFRTSCYEIGGDVFSLAELYHCVLRGNMSKPVSPKHPYIDIPRKSSAYSIYALTYTDPRIIFILNTGDSSCPQAIPVLRADRLEFQLQTASAKFIQRHLVIDDARRVILIPKVCDVYRNDFGPGDALSCLGFCTRFLSADRQRTALTLMKDDSPYAVKFLPCAEQYHQLLTRLDQDEENESDALEDMLIENDGSESVESAEM